MTSRILDFLKEDMGPEDVTTNAVIGDAARSRARIIAKDEGVIAGHPMAKEVFSILDEDILYIETKSEGARVGKGDICALIEGKTRAILTGERVALNILQRLSGIASATKRFVDAIAGTGTVILDTRKTSPGLREMEKYAVRMGGGTNHRMNLNEMALIKENHIAAAGSISEAVKKVRGYTTAPIEVEVRNMGELEEAVRVRPESIMLDNWGVEEMKRGVAFVGGRIPLEASGNMTLERVRSVAETGVNYISVGFITHSYRSLDLSLLLES
jgi:nicotinate-nucleotide pyrophosphorylase (carboxylating)